MPRRTPTLEREHERWSTGRVLVGVDEVGRGPLAGDAAVRWDHANGMTRVLVDVDGDRLPDMLIRLSGRLQLDADSFLL